MIEPIIDRSNPDKKAIISRQGDFTYQQLLQHIQQYDFFF